MDTETEEVEILNDRWWNRVKYYAQLAIERVQYGVKSVKELLSTLTSQTNSLFRPVAIRNGLTPRSANAIIPHDLSRGLE